MKLAYTFLTLVLLFHSNLAFACYVQPKQQYVPADNLIERTNSIVLGKAVRAEFIPYVPIVYPKDENGNITVAPGTNYDYMPIKYTFDVIEVIKGNKIKTTSVLGQRENENFFRSKLSHHKEDEFWKDNAGRLYNAPDCEIHPSFVLGGTYLLFVDKPYHRKSFEFIGYRDDHAQMDKWLAYVKDKVG